MSLPQYPDLPQQIDHDEVDNENLLPNVPLGTTNFS